MKKYILILFFSVIFLSVSYPQTFQWVKNTYLPISFNPGYLHFPSTLDGSGNLITGSIYNFKLSYGIDFYGDVIINKYNNQGAVSTIRILTGKIVIDNLETDAAGSIYVSGSFYDTLRIDSANVFLNSNLGLGLSYYIIKFDNSGNLI